MDLLCILEPRRKRIDKYLSLENRARMSSARERDEILLYLAIESLNLWTQFCKSYVINSCRGVRSLSGVKWHSPHTKDWNREDVRRHLTSRFSSRRNPNPANPMHEPRWREFSEVVRCCNGMAVPNAAALSRASGLAVSFLRELHKVRNFAAHKCEDTRVSMESVARGRGHFRKCDLAEVMLLPSTTSASASVTRQWLVEMDALMLEMCS